MNINKFMVIGFVSLATLVGCGQTQESVSTSVETATNEAQTQEDVQELAKTEEEITEEKAEVDPVEENKKTATKQIQDLASLIGKTAAEVDAILGEPVNVQNLEDTDILLVKYYKVEYLAETARVEVIFNDTDQVVNYVSFVILKADDIETTKENFINTLTQLYGESTIERYLGVAGRQNRNWYDEKLTYDLTYYENNISLDIYPTDK
ncbi:MAG: hypothetical protein E7231_07025 [Cellulosilyticum sp.]|nr:hypothetical protein [Cellulosilyticum sp.]